MLLDTLSWACPGIPFPRLPRDGSVLIDHGEGCTREALPTPLRASTLPPHWFVENIDHDDDDGLDVPRSSSSSSSNSSSSGVACLRVGSLTPLCPKTFNNSSSSKWFCVQALWLGQEESEAWPPLPVSSSSSSLAPSPLLFSLFELRARVVSRKALDAYFSRCGRLRLRVLSFDGGRRVVSEDDDDDDDDDEESFLEASLPLCDGDENENENELSSSSSSSSSPSSLSVVVVATLSVSLCGSRSPDSSAPSFRRGAFRGQEEKEES